jgi:hypothetical protein
VILTVATRIVGVAAFTILPHRGDARGPAAMLRLLLVYLLMAPAAVVGVVTGMTLGIPAGIAAGVVIAIAECGALLLFAGTRLEGNAMAYAAPAPLEQQ